MKNTVVLSLLLLCTTVALTQSQVEDVVYLKNGSIIRGDIIELVPEKTVKIQTADRSVFVYAMTEVDKIVKEEVATKAERYRPQIDTQPEELRHGSGAREQMSSRLEPEDEPHRVTILGAFASPTGDLSSTSGQKAGYAQAGFAIGVDVNFPFARNLGWLGTAALTLNGSDFSSAVGGSSFSVNSSSWTGLWLLSGIRASGYASPTTELYAHGQVGFLVGSTPEITIRSGSQSATQASASSLGFAYGIGAGVNFNHIDFGLRFLSSEPEYQVQAQGTGGSASAKFKQSTSLVLFTFGVAI